MLALVAAQSREQVEQTQQELGLPSFPEDLLTKACCDVFGCVTGLAEHSMQ